MIMGWFALAAAGQTVLPVRDTRILVTHYDPGPILGPSWNRGPPEVGLLSGPVTSSCVNADWPCVRVPGSTVLYR